MIRRDPSGASKNGPYDLIIVGGGIYGAAVALESSSRGLRSLLLERDDFGSRTSASSLRILHGGLRYLQSLDLTRFRESVRERRWWLRTFPGLVEPLPCLMPLHGEGPRRRALLAPALRVNDALSMDRNRGVRADCCLPRSRLLSASETLRSFPGARTDRLEGGALWYDALMVSPHRILIEMLRWAAGAGATVLNQVEATEVLSSGGRVRGVRAHDRVHDETIEYSAPLVINAAGPWVEGVAESAGAHPSGLFAPSLAFNLLLDRPLPAETAVAVHPPGPGGPMYFLQRAGRFTFAGTGHAPWPVTEPPPRHTPEPLVARFLSDLREAIPGFDARPEDVVRDLWGLQPARAPGRSDVARRPVLRDHGRSGGPRGLVSVSGVKFTTAPAVARRALSLATGRRPDRTSQAFLGHPPPVRPWCSPETFQELRQSSPEEALAFLGRLIAEESPLSVEDLVLRRLDWGTSLADTAGMAQDMLSILGEDPFDNGGREGCGSILPDLPLHGRTGTP